MRRTSHGRKSLFWIKKTRRVLQKKLKINSIKLEHNGSVFSVNNI